MTACVLAFLLMVEELMPILPSMLMSLRMVEEHMPREGIRPTIQTIQTLSESLVAAARAERHPETRRRLWDRWRRLRCRRSQLWRAGPTVWREAPLHRCGAMDERGADVN